MSFTKEREGRLVFAKINFSFETNENPVDAKFTIKELDALFYNKNFLEKITSDKDFMNFCKKTIEFSLSKVKMNDPKFADNLKDLKLVARIPGKEILQKLF